MNSCAACHARRSTLSEERKAGAPLEDSHRLAMLTAPNYHADGQQREEVYVWGSFLQSRMHQNGVTCMDCHEPHSQKLRAEGNALCTRCHAAASSTPGSSPSSGRRQGRPVRHLPHADAELHGDPCPPGSQPAHPASRSLAVAGQPECL
ncbi:MAG: cytochrome c3 family protein [Candidatus Accumulibacter necessarius]